MPGYLRSVKLVVTGASGNIGSSILEAASGHEEIEQIVGVARRRPTWDPPNTSWVEADILDADLEQIFSGSDAVIHLAWAIQPSRDEALLERTNVAGSRRVFDAVAASGVPRLVYSSSVGAYASGPTSEPVAEDWPIGPIPTSTYSRHKAAVERELDAFESAHPEISISRMRPALVFKGDAASEIRRLFAGPFLPGFAVVPGRLPAAPIPKGLKFQAVHSCDVAEAFLKAALEGKSGAFNLAAEPTLDREQLAGVLETRTFPVPGHLVRALADLTWKAHLQPSGPGWIDLAMDSPLMSSQRARDVLAWQPRFSANEALAELLRGLGEGQGHSAPHLKSSNLAGRSGELRTRVGRRQWTISRGHQLQKYLADAHAIEKQALIQMRYAPRMLQDSQLARPFSVHAGETGTHEELVRGRLEAFGSEPVGVKDRAGTAGGVGMLLFARVQPDLPGKLVTHAYSYEHMEIAAYEVLGALSERFGDHETAELAATLLAQEQAMAARLEEQFDTAAADSLERTRGSSGELIGTYLADAHALESQAIGYYRHAAGLVDDPGIREIFRDAEDSAEQQRKALEAELARGDGSPAAWKAVPLQIGGMVVARTMGAQPDPITKLAGFAFAHEHLRVAGNRMLEFVAKRAGQGGAGELASAGASDRRQTGERIAETWGRLGGV